VRATNGVVGSVSLDAQTSVLAASGGKAASFTVLVNRVDNPVNAGIVSDGNVVGVHQDYFEILVGSILVDPVGVQHTQVGGNSACTFLGNRAQVSDEFELVDALVLGLTVDDTLVVGSLSATSADSNTVDNVALLGLVAELVGLVSSGGAGHANDLLLLAVFPGSVHINTRDIMSRRKLQKRWITPAHPDQNCSKEE
jgi:hypothetical protein